MSQQAGVKRTAPKDESCLASEAETAEYIADLLKQLQKMADTGGLVRLSYLLRECVEEAERAAAG
ncbi:MAG: hypothetical protein U5J99_02645 [Parvularculaceae bacterium]|nr:hypothetical protein [Parvularculaceae bacterium]